MSWLQLSCIVAMPAAGLTDPVRICSQTVLISFSTALPFGTPTIIVEYASSLMKLSAPGGMPAAATLAAELRIGMPPEKASTLVCWKSSEMLNLMNSHSAFLFLLDLNIGSPARPTGVPLLACFGHGAMANCLLIWACGSGISSFGQTPPPNMPRVPAAMADHWL